MYCKKLRVAPGSLGNNQGTFYNSEVIQSFCFEPSFWTKHALATMKGQEINGYLPCPLKTPPVLTVDHCGQLFKSQT